MEPVSINALAVQWEFRCHGSEAPERPWTWQCRSQDGTVVTGSAECFKSLHEAVADAIGHGFRYEHGSESASGAGGRSRYETCSTTGRRA